MPKLLHGQELEVYRNSSHAGQRELIHSKAPNAKDRTNERARKRGGAVDELKWAANHEMSKVRARVEHVFGVVKRLWGFTKARYRGLAKNATHAFTALALANLFMSRTRLMAQARP